MENYLDKHGLPVLIALCVTGHIVCTFGVMWIKGRWGM